MKSYIKIIIGALLIGSLFAYFFYKDINASVEALSSVENTVHLFQVGVFKNIDNAKNMQDNYTSAIIYEDNSGYFRVLVGIAYMEENKVKLEAFFTNLGVEYYIKDVKMNEEFTDMLRNYETVIIKSEEREVIENINAAMLELFLTYLN